MQSWRTASDVPPAFVLRDGIRCRNFMAGRERGAHDTRTVRRLRHRIGVGSHAAAVMSLLRVNDVARRRYRLAAWSTLFSLLAKALALVTLIVAMRSALPYLGEERFGAWMTIASIGLLLGFLDFGIGAALIGAIAEANARGGTAEVREVATGAVLLLAGLGTVAGFAVMVVAFAVPMQWLLKGGSPPTLSEARDCAFMLAVVLGASIPSQGMLRICDGLQRGWIGHLLGAASSLVAIVVLLRLPDYGAGTPAYLLATYGTQQLPGILVGAWLVFTGRWHRAALRSRAALLGAATLFRRGKHFVVLQIAATVGVASSTLIVSAELGSVEVADLAMVQRIFSLVSLPLMVLNASLWPAYADANARGDHDFIRTTVGRSMLATSALAAIGVAIVTLAHNEIVDFFSAGQLVLTTGLVVGFAAWTVLDAVGTAIGMYLNSRGLLGPQVITSSLFTVGSIAGMILAVRYGGLVGVPVATMASWIVFVALPLLTVYRSRCMPVAPKGQDPARPASEYR